MQHKHTSKAAIVTAVLVIGIGLMWGNYIIATYLLRLELPTNPWNQISRNMAPVATPLVFTANTTKVPEKKISQFARMVGMDAAVLTQLPNHHALLVEYSWIRRANPYPPLWADVYGLETDVYYLSFGYIGDDERYHQITFCAGEADTTPSFLVPKTRGQYTRGGDYFVQYAFYLSKRTIRAPLTMDTRTGEVTAWSPPPEYPNIDLIDWGAYTGGSSNGFEEIEFVITATVSEVMLALIVGGIIMIRRWIRRRRSATRPPSIIQAAST